MKMIKSWIVGLVGAISTFFGGIGAIISGTGLCACVLSPIFSLIGVTALIMGFLSDYSLPFLIIGSFLLIISFILHKKKRTCEVHRKK